MSNCAICGKKTDVNSEGNCIDCSINKLNITQTKKIYYCKTCNSEIHHERAFCDKHRSGEIIKAALFMTSGIVVYMALYLLANINGILLGGIGFLIIIAPFIASMIYRKKRFTPGMFVEVEIKETESTR